MAHIYWQPGPPFLLCKQGPSRLIWELTGPWLLVLSSELSLGWGLGPELVCSLPATEIWQWDLRRSLAGDGARAWGLGAGAGLAPHLCQKCVKGAPTSLPSWGHRGGVVLVGILLLAIWKAGT